MTGSVQVFCTWKTHGTTGKKKKVTGRLGGKSRTIIVKAEASITSVQEIFLTHFHLQPRFTAFEHDGCFPVAPYTPVRS